MKSDLEFTSGFDVQFFLNSIKYFLVFYVFILLNLFYLLLYRVSFENSLHFSLSIISVSWTLFCLRSNLHQIRVIFRIYL